MIPPPGEDSPSPGLVRAVALREARERSGSEKSSVQADLVSSQYTSIERRTKSWGESSSGRRTGCLSVVDV